jgi:serine/threonine protein kinase
LSTLEPENRFVKLLIGTWRKRGRVSLERRWRKRKSASAGVFDSELDELAARNKEDLRCRIERGEPLGVAYSLDGFPDLRPGDKRALSLIYEEYCLREERGETLDTDVFCDRYALWKESLVPQLQWHRVFNPTSVPKAPAPRFPEPGAQFEEFQLISLLGKGGSSRVFLARDHSLGGKRVALKVSLDHGQEPMTQGALDHPHIVPVNSVSFQLDQNLRGLSMPYRTGLPLDEIVRRVCPAKRPRTASALWEALFEGESSSFPTLSEAERLAIHRKGPTGDGWSGFPLAGTFFQGAAWVAMVLARTLHYAHGMHTFHRDVKPGNVLLTLQHGPQLLDFNLAESPHAAHRAESGLLGGTLPYMAPEQIEAFLDPKLWDKVGAKSDIYSLGLVLRELLTGQAPDLPIESRRPLQAMRDLLERRRRLKVDLRRFNPDVPHALEAIVKLCLSFSPDDRYPDAQALADDLDCFLARRPLLVAVNPSRAERLVNWTSRNRRKLVGNAFYLTLIVALASQWVAPSMKPDPATLPAMQQAVLDIEADHPDKAIEPLRKLVREYPEHPLPRAYLGIAQGISTVLVENDVQVSLGAVLDQPNAEPILVDWARKHPSLARHLSAVVLAQTKHVNRYHNEQATAQHMPGRDAQADPNRELERKYYETFHKAIQLALKIDPGSEIIKKQMATTEEMLGDFESAHRRLTELIETARLRADRDALNELIDRIDQRGRVAIRWSNELRSLGNPEAGWRAGNLLIEAVKDLEEVAPDMARAVSENTLRPEGAIRAYMHYWIATEACVALGELELAQGDQVAASSAFQSSKKVFDLLARIARVNPRTPAGDFEGLRRRVRNGLLSKKPQSQ